MRTPNNERLASQTDKADPDLSRMRDGAGKDTSREQDDAKALADAAERRCILAGESGARDGLIRLAVSPSGLVLPDVQARAPGRGAWIGVTRAELENAMAKGKLKAALARAFKSGDLEIPPDLPEKIEQALARVFLDRLGLELRSGALILGTQRIADAARNGNVVLLCHAADSSQDGRKKLDQAWRVGADREGSGDRGAVLPLDRSALSVALGRENVVHIAVAYAAAAARLTGLLQRLVHFAGSVETPPDAHGDTHGESAAAGEAGSSAIAASGLDESLSDVAEPGPDTKRMPEERTS